jgi:hypothetical protein
VDEDITGPINRYGRYRLYDAVKFDTTYPWIVLETIFENLEGATPLFVDYVKTYSRLPLLIRSDVEDEVGSYLLNIRDYPSWHQSGVAHVSDCNKIWGTTSWVYGLVLIGEFKLTYSLEEDMKWIDTFLKHENSRVALLNQGDDTLALAHTDALLDKWTACVAELDFAEWEEDDTEKFLGRVLYRDYPGAALRCIPDIATTVEKFWINERSVHSKHRKMSSMGNIDRLTDARKVPGWAEIEDRMNAVTIKHFGDTMENFFRRTTALDWTGDMNPETIAGLSHAERLFLDDESRIHYDARLANGAVRKEVLASRMESFQGEEVLDAIKSFNFMEPSYMITNII